MIFRIKVVVNKATGYHEFLKGKNKRHIFIAHAQIQIAFDINMINGLCCNITTTKLSERRKRRSKGYIHLN